MVLITVLCYKRYLPSVAGLLSWVEGRGEEQEEARRDTQVTQ